MNSPKCAVIREGSGPCLLPADLVLQSCDGELIGTHSVNVELCMKGVPPSSTAEDGVSQLIHLPEHSSAIRSFLPFIHNVLPESFAGKDPNQIADILCMGIKYTNWFAILYCETEIMMQIEASPAKSPAAYLKLLSPFYTRNMLNTLAYHALLLPPDQVINELAGTPASGTWTQFSEAYCTWKANYTASMDPESAQYAVHITPFSPTPESCPDLMEIVPRIEYAFQEFCKDVACALGREHAVPSTVQHSRCGRLEWL
ncbi:hypothetical protein VNI00_018312 [Paramarasmius palmivorus]|uniref:Uncharacterized protein n=1 Tax=Paramarasmius palmivorus TaxID=297713 RepID=A0AAW0AYN6_9AGAR